MRARLAVSLNHGGLNDDKYPPAIVVALRGLGPFELDQRNCGCYPDVGRWSLDGHMNAAELSEPASRTFGKSRGDSVEVAVEANQNRIFPHGMRLNEWVRTIGRELLGQTDHLVAARFKKLTDGLRHTVVGKELDRFEMAAQAASLCVRRAACTSFTVSDGYSATIASSEYPASMKSSTIPTGMRVPLNTVALRATNL